MEEDNEDHQILQEEEIELFSTLIEGEPSGFGLGGVGSEDSYSVATPLRKSTRKRTSNAKYFQDMIIETPSTSTSAYNITQEEEVEELEQQSQDQGYLNISPGPKESTKRRKTKPKNTSKLKQQQRKDKQPNPTTIKRLQIKTKPPPTDELIDDTKLTCLICFNQFEHSKAFSLKKHFTPSYCTKIWKIFCGLLQNKTAAAAALAADDANSARAQYYQNPSFVHDYQPAKYPLPFCTACGQDVIRLTKLQEQLQDLQASISAAVYEIKNQIFTSENSQFALGMGIKLDKVESSGGAGVGGDKTDFIQKYERVIEDVRMFAIEDFNPEEDPQRFINKSKQTIKLENIEENQQPRVVLEKLNSSDLMTYTSSSLEETQPQQDVKSIIVKVEPSGLLITSSYSSADDDDESQNSTSRSSTITTKSVRSKKERVDHDHDDENDNDEWSPGHHDIDMDFDPEDSEPETTKSSKKPTSQVRKIENQENQIKRSNAGVRRNPRALFKRKSSRNKGNNQAPRRPRGILSVKDGHYLYNGVKIYKEPCSTTNPDLHKFRCDLCNSTLQHLHYMKRHIRTAHKNLNTLKEFACHICEKVLSNVGSLPRHMSIFHSNKQRKLFECEFCGKMLKSSRSIASHKALVHQDGDCFTCDICSRPFRNEKSMIVHRLSHMNCKEKEEAMTQIANDPNLSLYQCKECGKTTPTETSLKLHQLVHVDVMPFVCDTCGAGFRYKCNLVTHLEIHRGSDRTFKYVCDFPDCDKKYGTRLQLVNHSYIHRPDEEKPHKCSFCPAGFVRRNDLVIHRRSHTGEKPYQCPVCARSFTRSYHLARHVKVVCSSGKNSDGRKNKTSNKKNKKKGSKSEEEEPIETETIDLNDPSNLFSSNNIIVTPIQSLTDAFHQHLQASSSNKGKDASTATIIAGQLIDPNLINIEFTVTENENGTFTFDN